MNRQDNISSVAHEGSEICITSRTGKNDDTKNQQRVLAAVCLSYALVMLDVSIVNVALERISHSFNSGITGLQWVVSAYTLSYASLLLTCGALGDRWGRKTYLLGVAIFTLASATCGLAPNLPLLVTSRILQGLGAAMLIPASLTLINRAYTTSASRAGAIGIWAGFGGAAMAAGPLVGGMLIHLLDWRSIFLANIPIGMTALWLTTRVADNDSQPRQQATDIAGQIMAALSLATLIGVLIEGPVLGWKSPVILTAMVATLATFVAFINIEARRPHALLPLSFFRNGIFSSAVIVTMISAFVFYGLVFALSLYWQQAHDYTPLQTGLAFLPLTAMVACGSILSNRLSRRYGSYKLVSAALALYTVGFIALMVLNALAYDKFTIALPFIGIAAGLITPAATAAVMEIASASRSGVAAGVLNTSRQAGAALGVAIFGALISTVNRFENGFHVALWVAIFSSVIAMLIWYFFAVPKAKLSDELATRLLN